MLRRQCWCAIQYWSRDKSLESKREYHSSRWHLKMISKNDHWACISFNLFEISLNYLSNCHILWLCYLCDYSISTLILLLFCNLIDATYYLEVFKYISSVLNVFTRLNNETSHKDSIKIFFVAIHCFFPPQSNKNPKKTATRHPVERSFRNRRVMLIFCKRTPPPSSHKLPCVDWGYKFLWILAVLPVSWATVLRFNWVGA